MAREITLQDPGLLGATLYATLDQSGRRWNAATSALEDVQAANWADYAVPLTEAAGTGYFVADLPAGLAPAVPPVEATIWRRAGEVAAVGDPVVGAKAIDGRLDLPLVADVRSWYGQPVPPPRVPGVPVADVGYMAGRTFETLGLARGGSETTLVLAEDDVGTPGAYVGQGVGLFDGTGVGQFRTVLAYDHVGKVVTVDRWDVVPDATTVYGFVAPTSRGGLAQGGPGPDVYDRALGRGRVRVQPDGSWIYYDAFDPTVPRVRVIPIPHPGGRDVVLDPT